MQQFAFHSWGTRATAVAATFVMCLLLAACGDSSGSSEAAPTSSTAPKPGDAKIVSFDVPSTVQCTGQPSTTFSASYATAGAKSQKLLVDGRETTLTDAPKGTVEPQVHCDGVPHTVVLYVVDQQNRPTSQRKIMMTQLPAAG